MDHAHWHPKWWKEEYTSAWERVREALRRDWQQTVHDLHLRKGHELNQKVGDTLKQAEGKVPIPDINRTNPPRVIGTLDGDWEKVEHPMEYGFAARHEFGATHPRWDEDIERELESEWQNQAPRESQAKRAWSDVRAHVRRGYEHLKY
jgi:hypothetical protein